MIRLSKATARESLTYVWEGIKKSFGFSTTIVVPCLNPGSDDRACHCCQLRFQRELTSVADGMR